ncbi:MAG: pyridoxal phosphate-dependent aminotransferase [Niameybacter sp.]|uniref:pyridoxal phosphate-dependent aminotransferase n=1 Tax=Niameybacter sp. TaxID=2033640 RepID=UPI002FCC553A
MISRLANSIAPSSTLAITAKANAMKAEGIDVIGFGAGEPDFDTPDYIKEAAIRAIQEGFTKYTPVAGIVSLRKAIAHKLQVENNVMYTPEQIVVSNGAKHSLVNTFMALLNPGDEVIIPAPFWLSYPEMIKMAHGIPQILQTRQSDGYKMKPEDLEKAINPKTRALILNSPSNPTGVVYTREEIQTIAQMAVKHDLWIVSDEIYEYLVYEGAEHTCVASLSQEIYDHTVTINGLSKSHAMTGWRIGYIAAPVEVAKAAANIQSHATSNPNSIAQKAAEAALDLNQSFARDMVEVFERRSKLMYEGLSAVPGFDLIKPHGAFYCFINVSALFGKHYNDEEICSAADFARVLLEAENVAVVPCQDFGASDCIRLSYAMKETMIQTGIARLNNFVESLR